MSDKNKKIVNKLICNIIVDEFADAIEQRLISNDIDSLIGRIYKFKDSCEFRGELAKAALDLGVVDSFATVEEADEFFENCIITTVEAIVNTLRKPARV